MQINLYEHNKNAYENALALLQSEKKAAVIHPTGTGKSFIAFRLCEDNPGKTVCWLSPSEHIFNTQLENLKKAANGYTPQNISFFTYAKLMNMNKHEITEIKPDYIILDEFHRCGAQMWGQGVKSLLTEYPDAPVLGLSATAIRYLDNQRNMADELFEGNVASEMSLGEAIVRGILNPPKYVLSVFSYQKDLEKYEKRVRHAKSKAVRDEGQKYLDALRRTLEQADGMEKIFSKHITEKDGKYIIFCADFEHMLEMIDVSKDWFSEVDENPHIYKAYSDDPETSREFADFKADNSGHLKLLYCIDMLNEGIHVDGISGVILLRPTVSPIIYKQQIGRALSANKTKNAVIFDIVMNIENLYSIGAVEEEMQLVISYYRSLGLENEIVNEHFTVIDEVRDCLELFDKLGETLTASWEYMYAEAKKYYEKNGNLDVPKRYKTENGYSLGNWITTQRRIYAGAVNGRLSKERTDRLDKIGMIWESRRDISWQKHFAAAKEYYEKHGDLNVKALYVTDDGIKLGAWIQNLRMSRKSRICSRYLTPDKIEELNKIGMIWEVSDFLWQRYYGACLTYYSINKNLDVPADYVTGEGLRLGTWITQIRRAYNSKSENYRLSDEQIKALDELGMVWDPKHNAAWNKGYSEALRYYGKHGNLDVPATFKTVDGFLLGKWIDRQRRNKSISEARKSKLDEIGMIWEKNGSWEIRYALLKKYFEQNGNLSIPTTYVADGVWLGKWLSEQKKKYKNGKLSDGYVCRLEELNIDWDADIQKRYDEIWSGYFSRIKAYSDKYGDITSLGNSASEKDKKLSKWLQKQRRYYKDGKLSDEKTELLKSVGIVWDTYTDAWETGFLHAKKYYEANGNLNIPASYADSDGYALGAWITNQRNNYRHSAGNKKITENQKKRLDSIGMVWEPLNGQWEKMYESAKLYFSEHGNLEVPAGYRTADGHSLREWLRTQRENKSKGRLSDGKAERLNQIGMDWLSPAARNWETYFSACEKYNMAHGNLEIGTAYTDENGLRIGRWLKNQRRNKAKLKTSGENGNQIKRLESIGMVWEESTDGMFKAPQRSELKSYAV